MAVIGFRTFSGQVPQLLPTLLPEDKAVYAEFCDFSQGGLSPLNQGLPYKTFSQTVKGIYTEDGINFFTWPEEVFAVKSPVVDDVYSRVYFTKTLNPGLYVARYDQATASGGPPPASYLAGVPVPTAPPVLSVLELNTLRDYPSFSLTFRTYWSVNGVNYGPFGQQVATEVSPLRQWTVPVASAPGGTPDGASPVVEITLTDLTTGDVVFTLAKDTSGNVLAASDALPGGLELQATFSGNMVAGGTATASLRWGVMETRAYTYTVVNQFAEEGGPAPASTVNVTYLQDVQAVCTVPDMTGYVPMTNLQLYRTFGASANYLKIDTTVTGTSGNTITVRDSTWKGSDAEDLLYTLQFIPPPQALNGLAYIGNGFFAGSVKNTVYFSEPYRPHAWPYNISFPHNVRGVQPLPSGCLVTTSGGTYLVQGVHPSAMVQNRIPVPQAGISQRSMAQIGGVVAFASNDGIVTSDGTQATLDISQQLWRRQDWRNAYGDVLNDMIFGYHDGFLVGLSTTQAKGFLVKLDEQPGTLTQLPVRVDALFYLPVLDTLYYSVGTDVYRFRSNVNTYTLTWKSKEFVLAKPTAFGCGFLNATAPVTVTIWCDDVQVMSGTIDPGYFRLPSIGKWLRWQFQFVTTGSITEISFAGSFKELQNA